MVPIAPRMMQPGHALVDLFANYSPRNLCVSANLKTVTNLKYLSAINDDQHDTVRGAPSSV